MTCAAMQPWLLRMHFRCVDMTPGRFASIQSVALLTVNRDHERFEMDFPSRPAVSCEIPTVTMTSIMCAGSSLHPRGSTKMLRPDQSSAHSSLTGPDALASKHFECS